MKRIVLLLIVLLLLCSVFTGCEIKKNEDGGMKFDGLYRYPTYPSEMPRIYDYDVTVTKGENLIELPVYNAARQSANFFYDGDPYRRFCEFGFEGEITISIKPKVEFTSYVILPSSRGVESTFENGVISFTISEPDNYVLRLNNDDNTNIAIFAEALESEVPQENDENVIYFKAGLNNSPDYVLDWTGRLKIESGQTVYLEPGALVMARPYVMGSNVKISGRGAFMDPRVDRYQDWSFMTAVNNNINAEKEETFKNVSFEGFKVLDTCNYNIGVREIDGLTVKDVKFMSNQISTDGFCLWGSTGTIKNVLFDGCLLYNSDDMTIFSHTESATVRNCIFASDHRFSMPQFKIGSILYENCDIFRVESFLRANGDNFAGSWDSVTYRNIFVEDAKDMNYFIDIQNGTDEVKNVTFENVSLPEKVSGINIENTKGLNITFNNVFVGGKRVENSSAFKNYSVEDGNSVNYGSEFDEKAACVKSLENATVNVKGGEMARVTVGGYILPPTKVMTYQNENGVFVPALEVLNALGYSAEFKDNTLTYSKGKVHTLSKGKDLEITDGFPMISLSAIEALGHKVQDRMIINQVLIDSVYDGENLIYESGFEENKNPYLTEKTEKMDYFYSTVWCGYDFGVLRSSEDAHSGKRSAHVVQNERTSAGIAQEVSTAMKIHQNGKYRLTFWAKLGECESGATDIFAGFVKGNWAVREGNKALSGNKLQKFTLTEDWQEITCEIHYSDSLSTPVFIYVGALNDKTSSIDKMAFSFFIDDVSLEYLG